MELSEDGTFDTANVKSVPEEPQKSVFTKTQEIASQEVQDTAEATKDEEEDDKTPPRKLLKDMISPI